MKKSNFKNIALIYRPDTKDAFELANRLGEWLSEKDLTIHMYSYQKAKNPEKPFSKKTLDSLDLVIVLGGDGTYLNAVRILDGRKVPILGINMGSLGFLTNTKVSELFEAVIYTLEGKMEMEPRAMLQIEVRVPKQKRIKVIALNDVVIERGGFSQLLSVSFYHKNLLVNEVKADGIVVATPTGSTAYNLSAGGPILHPEVACLVVTPIAPHSLTNRPMIFSDRHPLTFIISKTSKGGLLTADGKNICTLKPGDEVRVSRHKQNHFVVKRPTHNYYNLLREKLKFGERN